MSYWSEVAAATFHMPCQDTAASTSLTGGGTIVGGDTAATLTNTNGPTTWKPRALNLDGTNDYITTSFDLSTLGVNWTIGGWFYVNSGSAQTALNNFFYGTTSDNRIGASWGHTTAATRGGGAVYLTGGTYTGPGPVTLSADAWIHHVVQVQGTAMRCYVNGSLAGSTTVDSATRTGTLIVASRNGGNNKLTGRIAGLIIIPNGTASAAELYAGPEPTLTTDATIDENGVIDLPVFNSYSNGSATIQYQWQIEIDEVWTAVDGQTTAADGPADFGGVSGLYRLAYEASNLGGTGDTSYSNEIEYVAPTTPTRRRFSQILLAG